tara:strand:- start:7 stop:351 length:345 start_codon:yes stop_codon:yes gene_type:complete
MIVLITRGKEIQFHPNFSGFNDIRINTEPDFSNIVQITNIENAIREHVGPMFKYLDNYDFLLYKHFGIGYTSIDVHITTMRKFITGEIRLFDNIDRMTAAVDFLILDFEKAWQD